MRRERSEKEWMNRWSNGTILSVKHGGSRVMTQASMAARRTGSLVFLDIATADGGVTMTPDILTAHSQPDAVLHYRWIMTQNLL